MQAFYIFFEILLGSEQLQIIKFAETIALYNIFPGLASGLYSKRRGGYNVEYIWKENGNVQSF